MAVAGMVKGPLGGRVDGQDVIAVHPDAGNPVAAGAVDQRNLGLDLKGNRDGPVVVLAEEHHGGVVGGGENH